MKNKLLKFKKSLSIIGLVCAVAILVGTVVFTKIHSHPDQSKSVSAAEQLDSNGLPPEMKQLLAETDTTKQAEIVKEMAEKYGPKQALQFMEKSGLPYTGETHLLVHQIGTVAYEKYGDDALLYCDESFLAACYHGVVLNELAENGMNGLAKMMEKCKEADVHVIAQCSHAAGHGFLALKDYKVLDALPMCDQLNKLEPAAPAFNCYDGVFMENIFGVHEGAPSPNRMVKDSDPNYPCDAVPEKYRGGCWADQATLMYEIFHGDLRKVAQGCDAQINSGYKTICYNNFAREIHPMTKGDASVAVQLCQNATGTWKDQCLITIVDAAFSVGDTKVMPYELCFDMADSPRHADCYQEIYANIQSYATTPQLKAEYCGYIKEQQERQDCATKFNVSLSSQQNNSQAYSASEYQGAAASADFGDANLVTDAATIKSIAQKSGVEKAYEYLKQTWGNNPVEGHDLAHIIGQLAYQEKGMKGFAVCDSAFGFGCYHGLLEVLLKEDGPQAITKSRQACDTLPLAGQVASCLHGIGHGVMSYDTDIKLAVKDCGVFPDSERSYCYDGVFMEYYTGIMKLQGKNLTVDFNKPWDFCLSMPGEAQGQCVRNATFFLLYSGPNTATSLVEACNELASQLKPYCVQTAGLYAAQTANGNIESVNNFCKNFKNQADQSSCISSAAQEFIFENKGQAATQKLCQNLTGDWQVKCQDGISQMMKAYGGN